MPFGDRLFRKNSRFDKTFDNIIKTDFATNKKDVFPAVARPAPILNRLKDRMGLSGSIADKYDIPDSKPEPQDTGFSMARGPPTSYGIYVSGPMKLSVFESHVEEFRRFGVSEERIEAWRKNLTTLGDVVEKAKREQVPTHDHGGITHYLVAVATTEGEAREIAQYLRDLGTESVRAVAQHEPKMKLVKGARPTAGPAGVEVRYPDGKPGMPPQPTWGQMVGKSFTTRELGQRMAWKPVESAADVAKREYGIAKEAFLNTLTWNIRVMQLPDIQDAEVIALAEYVKTGKLDPHFTMTEADIKTVKDIMTALSTGQQVPPPIIMKDLLLDGTHRLAAHKLLGHTGIIVAYTEPTGAPTRSASDMSTSNVPVYIVYVRNPTPEGMQWFEQIKKHSPTGDRTFNDKIYWNTGMRSISKDDAQVYKRYFNDVVAIESYIPYSDSTRSAHDTSGDHYPDIVWDDGRGNSLIPMSKEEAERRGHDVSKLEPVLVGGHTYYMVPVQHGVSMYEASPGVWECQICMFRGTKEQVHQHMVTAHKNHPGNVWSTKVQNPEVSNYSPSLQDVIGLPLATSYMTPYVGDDNVYGIIRRDAEKMFGIDDYEFRQWMRWKATEIHPKKINSFVSGIAWIIQEFFDDYSLRDPSLAKVVITDAFNGGRIPQDVKESLNITGVPDDVAIMKILHYIAEAGKCFDDIRLRRPEDIPVAINGQALFGIGRLAYYQVKGIPRIVVFMADWPPPGKEAMVAAYTRRKASGQDFNPSMSYAKEPNETISKLIRMYGKGLIDTNLKLTREEKLKMAEQLLDDALGQAQGNSVKPVVTPADYPVAHVLKLNCFMYYYFDENEYDLFTKNHAVREKFKRLYEAVESIHRRMFDDPKYKDLAIPKIWDVPYHGYDSAKSLMEQVKSSFSEAKFGGNLKTADTILEETVRVAEMVAAKPVILDTDIESIPMLELMRFINDVLSPDERELFLTAQDALMVRLLSALNTIYAKVADKAGFRTKWDIPYHAWDSAKSFCDYFRTSQYGGKHHEAMALRHEMLIEMDILEAVLDEQEHGNTSHPTLFNVYQRFKDKLTREKFMEHIRFLYQDMNWLDLPDGWPIDTPAEHKFQILSRERFYVRIKPEFMDTGDLDIGESHHDQLQGFSGTDRTCEQCENFRSRGRKTIVCKKRGLIVYLRAGGTYNPAPGCAKYKRSKSESGMSSQQYEDTILSEWFELESEADAFIKRVTKYCKGPPQVEKTRERNILGQDGWGVRITGMMSGSGMSTSPGYAIDMAKNVVQSKKEADIIWTLIPKLIIGDFLPMPGKKDSYPESVFPPYRVELETSPKGDVAILVYEYDNDGESWEIVAGGTTPRYEMMREIDRMYDAGELPKKWFQESKYNVNLSNGVSKSDMSPETAKMLIWSKMDQIREHNRLIKELMDNPKPGSIIARGEATLATALDMANDLMAKLEQALKEINSTGKVPDNLANFLSVNMSGMSTSKPEFDVWFIIMAEMHNAIGHTDATKDVRKEHLDRAHGAWDTLTADDQMRFGDEFPATRSLLSETYMNTDVSDEWLNNKALGITIRDALEAEYQKIKDEMRFREETKPDWLSMSNAVNLDGPRQSIPGMGKTMMALKRGVY